MLSNQMECLFYSQSMPRAPIVIKWRAFPAQSAKLAPKFSYETMPENGAEWTKMKSVSLRNFSFVSAA